MLGIYLCLPTLLSFLFPIYEYLGWAWGHEEPQTYCDLKVLPVSMPKHRENIIYLGNIIYVEIVVLYAIWWEPPESKEIHVCMLLQKHMFCRVQWIPNSDHSGDKK